jgi:hypothetical protein
MVGLFYIYLPMSWSIPTQVELDIIAGKAVYQTFQTGNGGQSILQVPTNSYAVIFGYDFSPAGGGFTANEDQDATLVTVLNDTLIRWFETQQISFYTGNDFYPFIHHVDIKTTMAPRVIQNNVIPTVNLVSSYRRTQEINNSPIARQVYITSTQDVTITHGLILNSTRVTASAIPVTSRTPVGLTYGGTGQVMNTQTNYGPAALPQNFMQPSPKDYQDFGFGALPGNADNQAFATPDNVNGLLDSTQHINSFISPNSAALNYFLCIHYALYSQTIPETRG